MWTAHVELRPPVRNDSCGLAVTFLAIIVLTAHRPSCCCRIVDKTVNAHWFLNIILSYFVLKTRNAGRQIYFFFGNPTQVIQMNLRQLLWGWEFIVVLFVCLFIYLFIYSSHYFNLLFLSAPCINSIKNTFYCSNWCTLL